MLIKRPNITFESFSDGVCNIYSDEEKLKFKNLGYSKKILGYKRYWSAAANQMEISKVIKIPLVKALSTYDKVTIDEKAYTIELIQEKHDTNPLSMDLTLKEDGFFLKG